MNPAISNRQRLRYSLTDPYLSGNPEPGVTTPGIPPPRTIDQLNPQQLANLEMYNNPDQPESFSWMNPLNEHGVPNVDFAGPVMVGPTGARNAEKILEYLRTANQQRGGHETLAANATNYLRKKYPTIYEKIKSFGGDFGVANRDMPENFGGYWAEPNPIAAIMNKGTSRRLDDYVETGAHELTHFVRHLRGKLKELVEQGKTAERTNLKTGLKEMVEGEYIPASQNFDEYLAQPAEVAARKGGTTGRETFWNFLDQVEDMKKADILGLKTEDILGIPYSHQYRDPTKPANFSVDFDQLMKTIKSK